MTDLDEKELVQKIVPRYADGKANLSPEEEKQFQHLITKVKPLSNKIKSMKRATLRRRLTRLWKKRGIIVLFVGTSGTGKTMAAEILAQGLNLPIYRIDLSLVVNKYIGETEKNLNQLLDRTELSDVILLFDEADALFSKRTEITDAHDRHANIEMGYLLQRMEKYEGVAVLATNRKENLDEAFQRRMKFEIDISDQENEEKKK